MSEDSKAGKPVEKNKVYVGDLQSGREPMKMVPIPTPPPAPTPTQTTPAPLPPPQDDGKPCR